MFVLIIKFWSKGSIQLTNFFCTYKPILQQRADLIILLFDAHKLDISDELKGTIDVLKGYEDKIRCILNKADQIDRQQLMRGEFYIYIF